MTRTTRDDAQPSQGAVEAALAAAAGRPGCDPRDPTDDDTDSDLDRVLDRLDAVEREVSALREAVPRDRSLAGPERPRTFADGRARPSAPADPLDSPGADPSGTLLDRLRSLW